MGLKTNSLARTSAMIYNNALQSTNNFRSDKNVISEVPKKKLTTKESENFSSLRIFHWEFQAVVQFYGVFTNEVERSCQFPASGRNRCNISKLNSFFL